MLLIDTGKDGYDCVREFERRVAPALGGDKVLAQRDYLPWPDEQPALKFLRDFWLGHVLEIGCGFGRMAGSLTSNFDSYHGVDPVREKIEYARRDYGLSFITFQHTPDPTNWSLSLRYDTVFTCTVVQHLTRPAAIRLMQLAREHLAPRGRILMFESDGCMIDGTAEQCEALYRRKAQAKHMIPKPLGELAAAADCNWERAGGCSYILTPRDRSPINQEARAA